MLRTEGRSERRGERSRRKLSQGKPQSKSEVTYTKQQIHIVTNSKKKQGQENKQKAQFKGEGRKNIREASEANVSQNA